MRKINEIEVRGKCVLVRCDFNVPLGDGGQIESDIRIRQALPTISYLMQKGAKIILLSHFKEPSELKKMGGEETRITDGSIYPVYAKLSSLLKKEVKFVPDCIGEEVRKKVAKLEEGEVLLLENVRIYQEEKENTVEFGKELASLGEVFINDAFSVSHRNHASVTKVPLFLPSGVGILMEKEIRVLEKVKKHPARPIVAIIGGAKVESKITAVDYFLKNADYVLLGGKIANTVLATREMINGFSEIQEEVIKKGDYNSPKLYLPEDVIISSDDTGRGDVQEVELSGTEKGKMIFDIGEKTRETYKEIIKNAGTIIWAGPLGLSEREPFAEGTKEIGESVIENKKALKIVGGGDTGKVLKKMGFLQKIDLVSYGGGAMLTYLREGAMPGIEALQK